MENDLVAYSGAPSDLRLFVVHSAHLDRGQPSQVGATVRTGDNYAWAGHFNTNVTGTANGLNQLTGVGAKSLSHDARGNVTAFGTKSFSYSSENLLLTGPGSTTLAYDPFMRLYQSVSGGATSRIAYDALDRIAEYNGSNALLRRYVHGASVDEPLVWYEGSGTSDRRFLSSDDQGSVISLTDSSGTLLGINRYDEFGNPQSGNLGAFGYTGQAWLTGANEWYYKARVYDPELGRFLQTDPIDVEGGINLYAYVHNDPINFADPLGFEDISVRAGWSCATAPAMCMDIGGPGGPSRFNSGSFGGENEGSLITVKGPRPGQRGRRNRTTQGCSVRQSTFGQIATWADSAAQVTEGIAVGSATLGLITAPTGVGGAFFGGTALAAGTASKFATVVSVTANLLDGNVVGAANGAGAFIGGSAGGLAVKGALGRSIARSRAFGDLSAGQQRAVNVVGDAVSGATGQALGTIGC